MDNRRVKPTRGLGNLDPRWVDMVRTIQAEQITETPRRAEGDHATRGSAARARVRGRRGEDPLGSSSGTERSATSTGVGTRSTEARRRSDRTRTSRRVRRFAPTRPGEYVLMDTTPLDVFGFDPVSGDWVNSELTVAMDLYDRAIGSV